MAEKYAWNTARRAVAGAIRESLKDGEAMAEIRSKEYAKEPGGLYFVKGVEQWITDKGRVINVEIKKED